MKSWAFLSYYFTNQTFESLELVLKGGNIFHEGTCSKCRLSYSCFWSGQLCSLKWCFSVSIIVQSQFHWKPVDSPDFGFAPGSVAHTVHASDRKGTLKSSNNVTRHQQTAHSSDLNDAGKQKTAFHLRLLMQDAAFLFTEASLSCAALRGARPITWGHVVPISRGIAMCWWFHFESAGELTLCCSSCSGASTCLWSSAQTL